MIKRSFRKPPKKYNLSPFNKRLIEALEARAVSQADLARAVGVPPSNIFAYRSGKIQLPGSKVLARLSSALKVNYKWLRGDEGEEMNELPPIPPKEELRVLPSREKLEEQEVREGLIEGDPTTFSAYLDRMLPLLCHFMEDRQKERAAFIECFKEYARLDDTDKAEIRGEMRQMLKAEKYR